LTVSFTPPAHRGGLKIINYRTMCTSANGGKSGSKRGPTSPITVNRLTPSKTYTCTVRARNIAGYGPDSAPSGKVTPLAP
jgi:hypothetical protein